MEEIPNNQLGYKKKIDTVNNGISTTNLNWLAPENGWFVPTNFLWDGLFFGVILVSGSVDFHTWGLEIAVISPLQHR